MTTLIRDNLTGGFKLPDDPSNKFNTATGQPNPKYIDTGSSTNNVPPSYSNLTANQNAPMVVQLPDKPTGPINTTQTPSPTVNFTTALIQMLKEAQQRDTTGQAGLMKQSQGITGQGINDAVRNFNNPLLAPSSGTSLGLSAQNQFDPLTLSIANQQKLASGNLNNITDLVKQTSSDYQDEQDRIQKAKEDALNRATKASNMTFDTQANISHQVSAFEKIKGAPYLHGDGVVKSDKDNYVAPEAWTAALNNWMMNGGTYASFVSNFKRYLNPSSYDQVGIGTDSGA